jgi:hypothetical protein
MSLIIAPLVMLGAVVKIVERHDYPTGDLRNDPLFWIVTGAFFFLVGGTLIVGSIRALRIGDVDVPPVPGPRDIHQR